MLLRGMPLAIIVWGSGVGYPEDYEKRVKIRSVLQDYFINAEVKFSEDEDLRDLVPGRGEIGFPQEELWELNVCDVCIALDTSEGVAQEIARFVNTALSYKLIIFSHEKYKGSSSFPASLRDKQNQQFYSDYEYSSCDVTKRVLTHVQQVALTKLSKSGRA